MRVGSLLAAIVLAVLGFGLVLAAPLQLTTTVDRRKPATICNDRACGRRVQAVVLSGTLCGLAQSSQSSTSPVGVARDWAAMFEDNDYWVRHYSQNCVDGPLRRRRRKDGRCG
jgi:hypothetical protein